MCAKTSRRENQAHFMNLAYVLSVLCQQLVIPIDLTIITIIVKSMPMFQTFHLLLSQRLTQLPHLKKSDEASTEQKKLYLPLPYVFNCLE